MEAIVSWLGVEAFNVLALKLTTVCCYHVVISKHRSRATHLRQFEHLLFEKSSSDLCFIHIHGHTAIAISS